ncbi:MAG: hypothetical protein ACRCYU_20530 [Nocardioides sp.]
MLSHANPGCVGHAQASYKRGLSMTLGIAFAARDYVGVVTDRRLTVAGKNTPISDDEHKSGVVILRDGRLTYTFAGLATVGEISIARWTAEHLGKAAEHATTVEDTLEEFARTLSDFLSSLSVVAEYRRLTITFAGYKDTPTGATTIVALTSNFQDFDGGEVDIPRQTVDVHFSYPSADQGEIVFIGARPPENAHLGRLVGALANPSASPQQAVLAAVAGIRAWASDPASAGVVGQACSSALLTRNPDHGSWVEYHPDRPAASMRLPSYTYARWDDYGAVIVFDVEAVALDATGSPRISKVPATGGNRICPCGSCKKYKHCCGKGVRRPPAGLDLKFDFMYLKVPQARASVIRPGPGSIRIGPDGTGPVLSVKQQAIYQWRRRSQSPR